MYKRVRFIKAGRQGSFRIDPSHETFISILLDDNFKVAVFHAKSANGAKRFSWKIRLFLASAGQGQFFCTSLRERHVISWLKKDPHMTENLTEDEAQDIISFLTEKNLVIVEPGAIIHRGQDQEFILQNARDRISDIIIPYKNYSQEELSFEEAIQQDRLDEFIDDPELLAELEEIAREETEGINDETDIMLNRRK